MNGTAMRQDEAGILDNPAFKAPGLLEKLGEALLGTRRQMDCIQIETTSVCMAACVYCPHTTMAKSWRARHISPEVFASLWPLLRQAKRAHLQGWGEPLLHPVFFDLQAFAAKAGCQTSTTSCGMVMNEDIAAKLAASGMDIIAFSLAGTDQESNAVRERAPFDKVCKSIKILRKAIIACHQEPKLEIHLAYLMLADRVRAVSKLPELMDRLDVEMAVISTLDYLALPEQRSLAFYPDETEKLARAREHLEAATEKAAQYGRIIHYELPCSQGTGNGCRENIGKCLYVDAAGQISPCIYLNVPGHAQKVFGSSLAKNPLEIWRQEDFRSFRNALLSGKPDEACQHCPKRFES